jgi:2-dehydro-3-deoxy-D-gluconate 5-dehydrogenase
MGKKALICDVDIRKVEQIKRMVGITLKEYNKIDILINCAGVTLRKSAIDITESEWDEVLSINLKGTFFCCQHVGK